MIQYHQMALNIISDIRHSIPASYKSQMNYDVFLNYLQCIIRLEQAIAQTELIE